MVCSPFEKSHLLPSYHGLGAFFVPQKEIKFNFSTVLTQERKNPYDVIDDAPKRASK